MFSAQGIFSSFSSGPAVVCHFKKLQEVDFADKQFLQKKINNKDVYMWIMVCYRRCSRRAGKRVFCILSMCYCLN